VCMIKILIIDYAERQLTQITVFAAETFSTDTQEFMRMSVSTARCSVLTLLATHHFCNASVTVYSDSES